MHFKATHWLLSTWKRRCCCCNITKTSPCKNRLSNRAAVYTSL